MLLQRLFSHSSRTLPQRLFVISHSEELEEESIVVFAVLPPPPSGRRRLLPSLRFLFALISPEFPWFPSEDIVSGRPDCRTLRIRISSD